MDFEDYLSVDETYQVNERQLLGKILSWFSVLSLAVFVGTLKTVLGMVQVYNSIVQAGAGNPEIMAAGISQSLVSMIVGIIVGLPALLSIFVVLYVTSYRSKRFYYLWIFVSITWLLAFPFGTLFGLLLAVVLYFKHEEFFRRTQNKQRGLP